MRVPSALCGVFGLRPTVGRTSTAHCPENAFSIMSFGTHTGSIADAALVYAVISNAGKPPSFELLTLIGQSSPTQARDSHHFPTLS